MLTITRDRPHQRTTLSTPQSPIWSGQDFFMSFYHPPRTAQGQYRYDPTTLGQQGPARLFPYAGEDGVLRYIATQLGQTWLTQGQLSQPWLLLAQRTRQTVQTLDQLWFYLTTEAVELQVFQSGWWNWELPPDEQFDVAFVRSRRQMIQALRQAKQSATQAQSQTAARSQFYHVLTQHGRSQPLVVGLHERDGGLSDREFARQRVAGCNPTVIRQCQPQDQEHLLGWSQQPVTLSTGAALDWSQAHRDRRLFIADYPLLANLSSAELQPGRYVGSPIAVFYQTDTGLEPVLIQPEAGSMLTRTADTDAWMRAKLYVQVADATHHELIAHLCDTHLAMEALAIATPRQLPVNHPLYRLLKPHFQFLLAINTRGNQILLGEGAAIDQLLAPTRQASLSLINRAYRDRPFLEAALPTQLRQRGVGAEHLPDFPYRDDALLLWQAIARYTQQFLQRYYADDHAVQQDLYLQAWAAELGEPLDVRPVQEFAQAPAWMPPELSRAAGLLLEDLPTHARVPGFPAQITSLSQVIELATHIIFTCAPHHAAVNFSQFDYLGYAPNAPIAAYCPPSSCTAVSELLPPRSQDLGQMELTFALSGIRWGRLGSSVHMGFTDPGDRRLLAEFQAELQSIEQQIGDRNRQRRDRDGVDYPYLLPSRVPNSINI